MERKKRERGRGEGSAYQDKNGQWWAKLPLGNGKHRRARCASHKEAKSVLKAWIVERDAGVNLRASQQLVKHWLVHWLSIKEPTVTKGTYTFYQRHAGYAAAYVGSLPLEDIEAYHIDQMTATMLREGVNAQTVRHTKTVLGMALKAAAKAKAIRENPATLADPVSVKPYRGYTLRPDESNRLLAACRHHRLYGAVLIGVSLGLRRGEVIALLWANVQLDAGVLLVPDGKTDNAYRTLPLTAELIAALRERWTLYREEVATARQREQERGEGPPLWREHGLVFPSEVGTPISGRNFTRFWKETIGRANKAAPAALIPTTLRFHDLRHYAMSQWYAAGADPKTVQSLAGHADPTLSQKVYAHAQVDRLRATVEAAEKRRLG